MTTPTTISNLKIDPTLIGFLNSNDNGNYVTVISYSKKTKNFVGQLTNGLTMTREGITFDSSVVDGINTGAKIYIETQTGDVSSVDQVHVEKINTKDNRTGCMKSASFSKEF